MHPERSPAVYILASQRNGTLYVGVTSDICARVSSHRLKLTPGSTTRYGVTRLVHIEHFGEMGDAIAHEKKLKKWRREWQLELIEKENPEWKDLFEDLCGKVD